MRTHDRLHALIDGLPEGELPAVERLLAATDDPFLRALANAPEDDEPLTPEDAAAIQAGLDAIARGDVLSSAEVGRRLGHDHVEVETPSRSGPAPIAKAVCRLGDDLRPVSPTGRPMGSLDAHGP